MNLLWALLLPALLHTNDAQRIRIWADYYSQYYRLDKKLVYLIIESESPWVPWGTDTSSYRAKDQKGDHDHSFGPMQIKLHTAKVLWPNKHITEKLLLYDVRFNINTGCRALVYEFEYFRAKTKTIRGAWLLALTSYNKGRPKTIRTWTSNEYARRIYTQWRGS